MKYLTALVWLSLAVAPQAVLAADSPPVETASADFTATIELPGDEAPLLEFTGNLAWLKPKLRVELINPVSQETTIALIDLESLQFIALYPDTLNGVSVDLSHSRHRDDLRYLAEVIGAEVIEPPKGWSVEELEPRPDDGETGAAGSDEDPANLHGQAFISPEGRRAELWTDADGHPVELRLNEELSVTVRFDNLRYGVQLFEGFFEPGEDYQIKDLSELEPDEANPLLFAL